MMPSVKPTIVLENSMDFLDIFMLLLFIGFMIFVFGGYHKDKYDKRTKED